MLREFETQKNKDIYIIWIYINILIGNAFIRERQN